MTAASAGQAVVGASRPGVLVVDDRAENVDALVALLDTIDCDVVTAASGPDALRHLLHRDFAVILLDVQMPGMDGYETAAQIKSRQRNRTTPIIFLTAISREHAHHVRGYSTGAVDYLAKPIDPDVLRAKVKVFLELHTAHRLIEEQAAELRTRLTEREAAQASLSRLTAALQRSNAQLERFALAATHDLLEPAQVAAGLLALLDERAGSGLAEGDHELLARARHSLEGLQETITRLLERARLASAPELTPVALGDVVSAALDQLAVLLADCEVEVTVEELPTVAGDGWALQQVFAELVTNAVNHGGRGRAIHVGLAREDAEWTVMVQDDGPGLSPADLPEMVTLENVARPESRSGLAMCRRVVERHQGRFWIEAPDGGGTIVYLTFPLVEPA